MKLKRNALLGPGLAAVGLLTLVSLASAQQPFVYKDSDLCLTLRMVPDDNNEVVINLGQASTYVNAPIGTTIPITAYSPAQLVSPTFSSFDNLHWAVFGWYISGAGYPGYPAYTLWLTVPRADNNVRSDDAARHRAASQLNTQNPMASILANAAFISRAVVTSNAYNNATFVRESVSGYSTHLMELWMESLANTTIGTLNDTWRDNNLENATYLGFDGSGDVVRSDLYEVRPLDNGQGGTIVDPHTGTSGLAYYVGYFEFGSDGSMTFVREAVGAPPSATTLAASAVTAGSATLNASINPNGSATIFAFQYGTDTTYGSSTPVATLSSGTTAVSTNASVAGLLAGTTYHYRVVSTNSAGFTLGSDLTFTTQPVTSPQLGGLVRDSSGFKFTFSNTPGASFTVWCTTNVALPFNQWSNLGPAAVTAPGQYQFLDPQAGNSPQRFYRVTQP